MKDKKSKLVKDTIIFFMGNIGSKIVQFFLVPLYTYTMTASDFGKADLVLTTSIVLMPVFSLQLSDGLLRFGLNKDYKKSDVYNSTFRILIVCSLLSLLLSPIFKLFNGLKDYVFFLIIILNLRIYKDILSIMLKVEGNNKAFAIDSIVYTLTLSFF